MLWKGPSQAHGESSPAWEGVEGTLPSLGNQALGAYQTTETCKTVILEFCNFLC